jgi:hypothetical protein
MFASALGRYIILFITIERKNTSRDIIPREEGIDTIIDDSLSDGKIYKKKKKTNNFQK